MIGKKHNKLSNHLGKVLTVIKNKLLKVEDATSPRTIAYDKADIVSAQDYYPFGMVMPGRQWSQYVGDRYRFGFQGQEKDDEIKGEGNSYTAEFWQYDSRLARRWNIDPVVKSHESPYVSFNNNPMIVIDPLGNNGIVIKEQGKKRTVLIIKANYHYIEGTVSATALNAVKREFNGKTYKKLNYQGEKVDVRFEIDFIAEKEGTDLNQFDGSNGENRLTTSTLPVNNPERSSYQEITIDPSQPKGEEEDPNGKKHSYSEAVSGQDYAQSILGHGIGHNIGMIHDDGGIMKNQRFMLTKYTEDGVGTNSDETTAFYILSFPQNMLSENNVQKLLNRIEGMTKEGRNYWKNQLENSTFKEIPPTKDSGITTESK